MLFVMLELVWRRLGDVLDASWAILSALWRPLGDVSGAPLGHLGSFRGIEKGQDGARRSRVHFGCQLGSNLDYPLGRASERSERSARSAGMQCQADRGDRIAIKREIREKREGKRRGPHVLKCYLFQRASRSLLNTGFRIFRKKSVFQG